MGGSPGRRQHHQGPRRRGVGARPSLIDVVPEAVLVLDHHGRILFANARAERMFGHPRRELIGRPIEALIPQGDDASPRWWQAQRRRSVDVGQPAESGLVGVRREGSTFPVQVSLVPLNALGPMVVAAVIRDLTLERRWATAMRQAKDLNGQFTTNAQMFRKAFTDAPVAMALISARPGHQGTIIAANQAFCARAGHPESQLVGRHIASVATDGDGVHDGHDADDGDDVAEWIHRLGGRLLRTSVSATLMRDDHDDPDYVFVHHSPGLVERHGPSQHDDRRDRRDRHIAAVLQAGLLPALPNQVGHVRVATRYLPAGAGETVGGDWHDVVALPGGRLGLTVGDVAGHGVEAATTMTRLRYTARTLASAGIPPAGVISQLNQVMHSERPETIEMATVVHAQLDPARNSLVYSNAGHLPLVVLTPLRGGDGEPILDVRPLGVLHGPPVGVVTDHEYGQHHAAIDADSTLIGFTDGLIERRRQDIDHALGALLRALSGLAGPTVRDPEAVAEYLLGTGDGDGGAQTDDIAVVVITPLAALGEPTKIGP